MAFNFYQTETFMIRIKCTAAVALSLLSFGCGQNTQSISNPNDSVIYDSYQRMLSCDNGALVIRVDPTERRHIRVNITDPNIVRYLVEQKAFSRESGSVELSPDGQAAFYARLFRGLFATSDLSSFNRILGGQYDDVIIDGYRNRDGFKLVSHYVRQYKCDLRNGLGECVQWKPTSHNSANYHERANWYFRSCR